MNKYIIKNCPSHLFDIEFNEHICTQTDNLFECGHNYCQDCTNCLLKRIVEKCKEQEDPQIWDYKTDIEYFIHSARHSLAKEILSMLEIEECE